MPPGFALLIGAQFASALADNALLIVTIALLQAQGLPGWWAPVLKLGFTLSYVALAPFVGALADAVPKARLMGWMNAIKWLGVLGLLAGLHPVLAFVIVGFGAAAYAPAKFGLVTELVPAERLVAANGWIEVSVVCAALLGTVLGGFLVSPWWLGSGLAAGTASVLAGGAFAEGGLLGASIAALLGVYAVSSALTLRVPDSGARYAAGARHLHGLGREFWQAQRLLWRDPDGGLSLAVTTIFWGVGATLQFAVLRWAGEVLGLTLDRAAYLQAAVAVGVACGAAMAGRWVPLARAKRMLWAGVVLGLLLPVAALNTRVGPVLVLLTTLGVVGGLMLVPLNALLQHRGCQLLSAGRSIAVQGFYENTSVMAMLSVYALLTALDVPIVGLMIGMGLAIVLAMTGLIWREFTTSSRRATAS